VGDASPITDYMKFELTWGYAPNVAAGEDVRIIPVTDTWPADVPRLDFWIFDSSDLYIAHYDADGTWRGVEPRTDRGLVVQANHWRTAALNHAQAWSAYLHRHPSLIARLPPA